MYKGERFVADSLENRSEPEVVRLQNLKGIYEYFLNFLDEKYCQETLEKEGLVPWEVSRDEKSSPVFTKLEVRYSKEFAAKYNVSFSEKDPPIFRFHTEKYKNSYDVLQTPFSTVEINVVKDSYSDRYSKDESTMVEFDRYVIEIDESAANIISSPKGFLKNSTDIDHNLSKLSLVGTDQVLSVLQSSFFDLELNSNSFKQIVTSLQKIKPEMINITFVNDLFKKVKANNNSLSSDEYSNLLTVYSLLSLSIKAEEAKAYSFLECDDIAATRKKFLKTAAVATAVGLVIGVPSSLLLVPKIEKFVTSNSVLSRYDNQRDKELRVYRAAVADKLERMGVSSGVEFLRDLNDISARWNLSPGNTGDNLMSKLDNLSILLEQIAIGSVDMEYFYDESVLHSPSFEGLGVDIKFVCETDERWDGCESALKRYVKDMVEIFPFYIGAVNSLKEIQSELRLEKSETYYYMRGMDLLKIPSPWGLEWITSISTSVSQLQHELEHAYQNLSLEEVRKYVTLDDYTALARLQIVLAEAVINKWIETGASYHQYFSEWMFNSSKDKWMNQRNYRNMLVDFEYPEAKFFENATDIEINKFMFWVLKKFKDIKSKSALSSEEIKFLNVFNFYDIGNLAISHITHHFKTLVSEYMISDPGALTDIEFSNPLEQARITLFKEVCNRCMKKNPAEVIKAIREKILGQTTNEDIFSIFNTQSYGVYTNKGKMWSIMDDKQTGYADPFSLVKKNEDGTIYLVFNSRENLNYTTDISQSREFAKTAYGFIGNYSGTIRSNSIYSIGIPVKKDFYNGDVEYKAIGIDVKDSSNGQPQYFISTDIDGQQYKFRVKSSPTDILNDPSYTLRIVEGTNGRPIALSITNKFDDKVFQTLLLEFEVETQVGIDIETYRVNTSELVSGGFISIAGINYEIEKQDVSAVTQFFEQNVPPRFRYIEVDDDFLQLQLMFKNQKGEVFAFNMKGENAKG
ncbi:hypothetical protein IT417_01445 [bacterium]|nr:hypothetical protein [bacterium]